MEGISASYTVSAEAGGRRFMQELQLSAAPGESVFLLGSAVRRQRHFEVLTGLRRPESGCVLLGEQSLYAQQNMAAFRSEQIGAIPAGGGLLPEIPMIWQIALPLLLAGASEAACFQRIQELAGVQTPRLYMPPCRSPVRRQLFGVLYRALLRRPGLLVLDGAFDDLEGPDADDLWHTLQSLRSSESVLLYLSSDPAPTQVTWSQEIRI